MCGSLRSKIHTFFILTLEGSPHLRSTAFPYPQSPPPLSIMPWSPEELLVHLRVCLQTPMRGSHNARWRESIRFPFVFFFNLFIYFCLSLKWTDLTSIQTNRWGDGLHICCSHRKPETLLQLKIKRQCSADQKIYTTFILHTSGAKISG